jgi:Na+/H+ antiporter NhaB
LLKSIAILIPVSFGRALFPAAPTSLVFGVVGRLPSKYAQFAASQQTIP